MFGAARAGGSVRARDLAMGMLLACTSLVANAVVSGDGSLTPRTAAALPEPFMLQGAAVGPHRVGAPAVATATALASSAHPFTGSGPVVPDTATGQSDDGSLGHQTDGTEAPSGAVSVEPAEDPVAVPPATPPFEPVEGAPGDEPERAVAPVLQPVTELLASAVQPVAPSAVTEPTLSMLSPSLVA